MEKWIVHITDSCSHIKDYWRIVQAEFEVKAGMSGIRFCGTGRSNYGEDGYESCANCVSDDQFKREYRLLKVFPYSKEKATELRAPDFGIMLETMVDAPSAKK